jgi:cellulose synthase operon protein C
LSDFAAREKYADAAKSLKQMLDKFPNHAQAPVAMLKLGEVQADAGDFTDSLATYRQFLQKHADNPFAYRAHFGIGWALENQKKYGEAREAYAKVIASNNGETAARAQFQTGETLLAEGKFQDAVIELLKVEDVYKYPAWSARALLETGRAFEQLQQKDQAKQQYSEVITKYKDAPEAGVAQERLKTLKG